MFTRLVYASQILIITFLALLISPSVTYAAGERTVTYIGNYEVTVEEGVGKKETVRVAGTMGNKTSLTCGVRGKATKPFYKA